MNQFVESTAGTGTVTTLGSERGDRSAGPPTIIVDDRPLMADDRPTGDKP